MRIAWFAAVPTPLIRTLRGRHAIDLVDEASAHDFVRQQARTPADVCVFELDGAPAHQYAEAYAAAFPGVLRLNALPVHDRAIRASRLVVVPHAPVAQALADDFPGARIRTLAEGVDPAPPGGSDVVEALRWPPDGAALTQALAAFAAAKAVIVFDGPATADWPSLDPQTWQPRGLLDDRPPICVSVDPRDELHSLRLARARLDHDADLRARLGSAAHAWWECHATPAIAAAGFEALLAEARTLDPPADAPREAASEKARTILASFGLGLPWPERREAM